MKNLLRHRWFVPGFLFCACLVTTLLWLPSLQYPIVSDTSLYALLGESFWTQGRYAVLGELHGKHLPFHAIVSYPLVATFGYTFGMKLSTLLAAFGVLIALFHLLRRTWSVEIAVLTVVAVVFHHGFVGMTTLGSADLLLTLLFLLTLHFYVSAEKNPRWYIPLGITLGFACLTRYNAVPLFLFFPLYTLWKRPKHFLNPWFIGGLFLGGMIFASWFIRAYLVFGRLSNDYTTELGVKSKGFFEQMLINFRYYIHPLRNILPILMLSSIYGIYRAGKKQIFLLTFMIGIWSLFSVWPVLNLRYAFPGYVILLAFAVFGLKELLFNMGKWFPAGRRPALVIIVLGILMSHGLALCLYQYGSCNALWDRTIDRIPKNLGLATEGFHSWDLARDYINAEAPMGAEVVVIGNVNAVIWRTGVFRDDLSVSADTSQSCPSYEITHEPKPGKEIVFQTTDSPIVSVTLDRCE